MGLVGSLPGRRGVTLYFGFGLAQMVLLRDQSALTISMQGSSAQRSGNSSTGWNPQAA